MSPKMSPQTIFVYSTLGAYHDGASISNAVLHVAEGVFLFSFPITDLAIRLLAPQVLCLTLTPLHHHPPTSNLFSMML